jgi:hypothetical protein
LTLLAFVLPFILFCLYPSRFWNFDGVACAAALELGNPVYFFHSNHLLYGALGFLFWRPLFPWALPRALPALQLFTSLLSAAGLVGLYKSNQKLLKDPISALLLTLCLSVTAVVWIWSMEAQVYALGFLALCWATSELLRPDHPRKWLRIGLLHAGAVLGHVIHVLWIVPALYWLKKEHPQSWKRPLTQYVFPLGVGIVVPYSLALLGVILPYSKSAHWVWKWLMGSAVLNPNSVFQWHSGGWGGPLQWAKTSFHTVWGSFWPYHTTVPVWSWALTGISALIMGALIGLSFKKKRSPAWMFSLLWLAIYGLFFWTWEPRTECYRMTDMIPLSLLLALGLQALPQGTVRWATLTLLFVTLYSVNWRTLIAPMHNVENNTLYQETMALARATPESSLYLTTGGTPWIYLLYFTGRSAWDLHSFQRDPQHFASELRRHAAIQPVYVQSDALKGEGSQAWAFSYHTRPLDPNLPWQQLQ